MIRTLARRLLRKTDGSVAIEFALIGPALIGMMFAVLQVGVGMQNYNALRSVATDVARYTVVNYQSDNKVTADTIKTYGRALAIKAPYGLDSDRLAINVVTQTTSRVTGTKEMTLTMSYSVPTFLSVIGVGEIPISYSQPVFVNAT
jgi:Flp pilus assembly protein TadG